MSEANNVDLFDVSDVDDLEEVTDSELHCAFDLFIDETHPEVEILEFGYLPSFVLLSVDPTAYRCCFHDWLDSEVKAGTYIESNDTYYKS